MKKSLILISVVSSFLFSTLVYGLDGRNDCVLMADDGTWVSGYPAVVVDSKEIKDTKKVSPDKNVKVKKSETKSEGSLSTKELIRQEEMRKLRGLDYMVW